MAAFGWMIFCILTCIATLVASTLAFAPHLVHHRKKSDLFAAPITKTRGGGDDDPPPSSSYTSSSASNEHPSKLESLLAQAQHFLNDKNADGAFSTLAQAHGLDPTSHKVTAMFEACLSLKVELAEENYYGWKDDLDTPLQQHTNGGIINSISYEEADLNELFQDRMGLSSLFIDREHYEEAGMQLRKAIEEATFWLNHSLQESSHHEEVNHIADFSSTRFNHWQPQIDRAQYLLYRTNAACCHWETYFEDGDRLRQSLLQHDKAQVIRLLHPFDALKFPCISLELASDIARSYACRALESAGVKVEEGESHLRRNKSLPRRRVMANRQEPRQQLQRKIRIGYISPDFTSRHPLAFLMQHVFRYHDKSQFVVNIYSLSSTAKHDDGPEVQSIRESSDQFTYLSPSSMSPLEMYQQILHDELDILVDLCGYTGTSVVSEIMASRCSLRQDQKSASSVEHLPIHVSYMGFPGSVGSSTVWDYSVFDPIVVPPDAKFAIQDHYEEALVYMPHCYFVNSHKTVIGGREDGIMLANEDERNALRAKYGIHPSAFVFCCHSRPDKIDPATFRSWMRALMRIRSEAKNGSELPSRPVLWLLRSGEEMEQNLRQWLRREFGQDADDCLVFADVAERNEHLKRLGIADVFLDTPAYNAHTLGCDALYMGVPMISLLHNFDNNYDGNVDVGDSKLDLESADIDSDFNIEFGYEFRSIATDKLASRVGASLLKAVGLDGLLCPNMYEYEDVMVRCALDNEWFNDIRQRLLNTKDSSPLFDTERWVRNLEAAFCKMVELDSDSDDLPDILVSDDS